MPDGWDLHFASLRFVLSPSNPLPLPYLHTQVRWIGTEEGKAPEDNWST